MRLLSNLIFRLIAVVFVCLSVAVAWVVVDAHRTIERGTMESAYRVGKHLRALYWQKLIWRSGLSKESLLPLPDWKSLETLSVISPGVCVSFTPPGSRTDKLCSQVEAIGALPPKWFSQTYMAVMGPIDAIKQPLSVRGNGDAGVVITEADAGGALRQAWVQVSTVVGIAAIMAAAIALLSALMIGHALLPAQEIINALKKLQDGQLATRLPQFKRLEFNLIANAFNGLATNLAKTNEQRNALTTRLLEVQEEERRALARDLHDEFGQSLSATRALAALIEENALPDQNDIAEDARAISKAQSQMMTTLRTTLVRLRAQNVEEVGLEASLRELVADYNTQAAYRAVFKLNIVGELTRLGNDVAVDLYRIAQECLTNAVRHGKPTEVRLCVEHIEMGRDVVALSVEDNGGGDVELIKSNQGFGIMGMRERLTSLGGHLQIGNAVGGVRVSATVPIAAIYRHKSAIEAYA